MTARPARPSNRTRIDIPTGSVARDSGASRSRRSRLSNGEWLVLVSAVAVVIGVTTTAVLSPESSAASAAPAVTTAPGASVVCPTPAAVEATALASAPATSTSTAATASATTAAAAAGGVSAATTKRAITSTPAKKKPKTPAASSTNATSTPAAPWLVSVGTVVSFGSYQDAPVRWRVLDATEDELLLLSEHILIAGAFQSDWEGSLASRYSSSEVRTWLQEEFSQRAFSAEEGTALLPHSGGVTAGDRVFLLSASELTRYLPKLAARKASPRAGADQVGFGGEALTLSGTYASWWLADAAGEDFSAQVVEADGTLGSQPVYYADLGVRPAIRVDRTKVAFALDTQEGD